MTRRLWRAGLLALGLLANCGGSASHSDSTPPVTMGGAAGAPARTGGEQGTAAGGPPSTGGVGSGSAGSANGDAGSLEGGSAQDGDAGAGGEPALMLPAGCHPRTPSATADLCSLGVDCETTPSLRTYCHRLDSGQWECQCANHESMYRLENTAGLQACALAARLCSDEALELGEETCEHESTRSDQDRCTVDVTCSNPITLDETTEARAWLMRSGGANCTGSQPGQAFGCACQNGSFYALLADSAELACGPLADFCMTGAEPSFDGGEETCSLTYSSSDSEGCYRGESCGPQMPLTDDVTLVRLADRYATCTPLAGGGSECSCSEQDTGFLFQLSTPPEPASCEAAIPLCDPNAVIEATSAPRCQVSVDDHGDACQGFLSCLQDATVDGRSIVARGTLGVACRRAAPGKPWVCTFASGPETARVELGAASANGAQACRQASTAYLESPGLYLGPSGDPTSPPDPVP